MAVRSTHPSSASHNPILPYTRPLYDGGDGGDGAAWGIPYTIPGSGRHGLRFAFCVCRARRFLFWPQ
jgi:hypothetical protein